MENFYFPTNLRLRNYDSHVWYTIKKKKLFGNYDSQESILTHFPAKIFLRRGTRIQLWEDFSYVFYKNL